LAAARAHCRRPACAGRHIEELRRGLLDVARGFGCELVMPPLMEHLESLLSGTGRDLDLKTFKLVDQLSGRTLGVRADATPQVARIDAHLLNRAGVTRLCYCGPCCTRGRRACTATREPLQFGAEIFGHAGLEADLEVQELALDCLSGAGLPDAGPGPGRRAHRAGAAGRRRSGPASCISMQRWPARRPAAERCAPACPMPCATCAEGLPSLYGGEEVLAEARRKLPDLPPVRAALDDLGLAGSPCSPGHPESAGRLRPRRRGRLCLLQRSALRHVRPGIERCRSRVVAATTRSGAVFGRNRPAVGFSLDLKELAELWPGRRPAAAMRAPWSEDAGLRVAVRRLREQGETVVCVLPGHEHEGQEFECDRELVAVAGQWVGARAVSARGLRESAVSK
jgi:ATP phosphoribosyltransferase regulatory subunit